MKLVVQYVSATVNVEDYKSVCTQFVLFFLENVIVNSMLFLICSFFPWAAQQIAQKLTICVPSFTLDNWV